MINHISHDYAKLSPDIHLDAILLDGTQFSLSFFNAWNIERAYITMLNYVSSRSFTIGLRKENIAAAGSQLTED